MLQLRTERKFQFRPLLILSEVIINRVFVKYLLWSCCFVHLMECLSVCLFEMNIQILDEWQLSKQHQWQNRNIKEWTSQQVALWLMGLSLERHIPEFTAKNVNGEQLLQMDSTELKVT